MEPENRQKIETVFHHALLLRAGEARRQYLEQICRGDSAALTEVKSLLAAFENDAEFLENSVADLSLSILGAEAEKSRTNTRCGSYEIREMLGSGGMGEVYAAIDEKLNRKVALKFLSGSLRNDNAAQRQLQREAQAVAMLEHPNICAVYGIEQIAGESFISMQFVEGMTLDKKLKTLTVTPDIFKSLAKQIVGAVAFAHSHGVIHRDLKSGNIMVADNGNAKILDFGLAKIIRPHPVLAETTDDNTSQFSNHGLIIGTISYMSPEQLRGEKLDFQTDIFSLGIILFELLAGDNPFHRPTQAETIAAILRDESIRAENITPPPSAVIVNLINKCLAKDKRRRFQSAAEILVELESTPEPRNVVLTVKKYLGVNNYGFLILLFLLCLTWGVFFYLNQTAKIHTLAILPVVNASNNAAVEYLSDGLTEGLINKFSKLAKLKVKSSALVGKYKGQQIDPQMVGNNLQADFLLLGKIIRRENLLVFQANLIDTTNGTQVWGNEYQIEKEDLIKTQEEITAQITAQLKLNSAGAEVPPAKKGETASPEAEDQYFRGRYYLNNRNRTNLDTAIDHFNRAIDLDPLYAKAYTGLADSYVLKSSPAFGSLTPKDSMLKAKAAVNYALRYDDNLGEAYNTLGLIKLKYEWNWAEAENNFVKSIALDPTSAPPHFWYSQLLILRKDFAKALAEAQKAEELDPLSSNNEINVGRIYYYARQNEPAMQVFSPLLRRQPTNRGAAYMLGLTYLQKGLYPEAVNLFERFYPNDKLYFAAQLGYGYGKMNRLADAQRILADLETISATGENIVPPQEKAIIYLGMGNKNKAFELFRQACEERFNSFPYLLTEHYFDGFHADPDYVALTNCVKPLS